MKIRCLSHSRVFFCQILLLLRSLPISAQTPPPNPPQPPAAVTLESLEQAYQTGVQRLQQERNDRLSKTNASYLAALDRAQQEAAARADLEGALAVKAERDRWTQGVQPTAAERKAMPARLLDLHNSYERSCQPILEDFKKRSDAFAKQYLASLERLQRQFVISNQLEKAVAVKTEAERIRLALAPAAPASPVSSPAGPPADGKPAPAGALTAEEARRLFQLPADHWSVSGDILSGHYGHYVNSGDYTKSAPLGPSRELQFSFEIKAKWYHGVGVWIDGDSYMYSRGHWDNTKTMSSVNGSEMRLPGVVEDPEKWATILVTVRGGKLKIYYNGKLEVEHSVESNRTGHVFNVAFKSHQDDVQIRNVVLKAPPLSN